MKGMASLSAQTRDSMQRGNCITSGNGIASTTDLIVTGGVSGCRSSTYTPRPRNGGRTALLQMPLPHAASQSGPAAAMLL